MTKQHTTSEQEFEAVVIQNVYPVRDFGSSLAHQKDEADPLEGIRPMTAINRILQAHREAVQAAEDEAYDNIERLMSSRREADGQTISFVKLQRAIKKLKARSHNGGE